MKLKLYVLLFAYGATASVLEINPARPEGPGNQNLLSNATEANSNTTNSSNSSSSLGTARYECNNALYGNPHRDACREALRNLPNANFVATYGDRNVPGRHDDFGLPTRVTNCE